MVAEEIGGDGTRDILADLKRQVWEHCKSKCVNCGGEDRLRVRFIVPPQASGQLTPRNGVLLCRACEMARASAVEGEKDAPKRPINLWVSRLFYERLQRGLSVRNGFRSMSSLIRYLICSYNEDEEQFDDLEQYQDEGAEVKINVWVGTEDYADFKRRVDLRGITVTDAVKSLVSMYFVQAEPLVRERGA